MKGEGENARASGVGAMARLWAQSEDGVNGEQEAPNYDKARGALDKCSEAIDSLQAGTGGGEGDFAGRAGERREERRDL